MIPLTYLLGRESLGRAGILGAAIIALSPFSFFYGVEARPYATMAFFVVLSTFALLRAVRTRRWWWWVFYAVAAAAAAYTHYTAIFVLVVQGAWALWACRDRLRYPLAANVLAGALYLPWLPHVHGTLLNVYASLEPLNVHNVLQDLGAPDPRLPLRRPAFDPHLAWSGGIVVLAARRSAGLAAHSPRPVTPRGQRDWLGSPRLLVLAPGHHHPARTAALLDHGHRPVAGAWPVLVGARSARWFWPRCTLALPRHWRLRASPWSWRRLLLGRSALLARATGARRTARSRHTWTGWRLLGTRSPIIVFWSASALAIQYHKPHRHHELLATRVADGSTGWYRVAGERTTYPRLLHVRFRIRVVSSCFAERHYPGYLPITVLGYRRT